MHQAHEHFIAFPLVLDERVLLAPLPVVDRRLQLVEVVEVILPFLVDDGEHDVRQCLRADVHRTDLALDLLEVVELGLEGLARRLLRGPHQLVAAANLGGVREPRDGDQEFEQEFGLHERAVPRVDILRTANQLVGQFGDGLLHHAQRLRLELLPALEREQPQRVDHLPLLVHHIVVLEELFARLEVLQLDALLRLPDGGRHPRVGDDFVFLGAGAIHDARDAIRAEQPHQIVLER